MQQLTRTLLEKHQSDSYIPYVKAVIGKDVLEKTLATETILAIVQWQDPYTGGAEILIDNSDGWFTTRNYKGSKLLLYFGALTAVAPAEASYSTYFTEPWSTLNSPPPSMETFYTEAWTWLSVTIPALVDTLITEEWSS